MIEPRLIFDERRYEAAVPNLGRQWEGAEIAVISNLQVGMWFANTAADELTTTLESRGIAVLLYESAEVPSLNGSPDQPLHVVGLVGPAYQGLADNEEAFSTIPASDACIVMMHNPDTFPALPPDSAPLAVVGHTHCGQIAVPGTPTGRGLR